MKKNLFFISLLLVLGCKKYEEVDFQAKNCIGPLFKIQNVSKGNLRHEVSLNITSNTPNNQYPFHVVWTIEGKTYTGLKVSYQFDKKGSYPISVVFYNACLTEGTDQLDIIVK